MAGPVKLTKEEGVALAMALADRVGYDQLLTVLAATIGVQRALDLTERHEGRITKAETLALVKAIIPLVPGDTLKAKVKVAIAALREAIPDKARADAILAYVVQRIKDWKNPPPVSDPSAVPPWDACTRASCWNGSNAQQRMMNVLSPAFTEAKFAQYRDWMLSVGCNTAHVFLSNKADGEGAGYCIYGTSWTWEVNASFCSTFRARIADLRAHGLAVVVWLFADDSSAWNKEAKKNFPKYLADLKAQGLLDQASIVVAGLELDEYYGSADVAALVNAIRKVWTGKVGTHQTSGRYEFSALADVIFYQVNPGKTAAQIKSETQKVIKATGKPLCFFELARQPNRALCDAAFDGGAFAVGNWKGEAVFPPQTPASDGWPAELEDVVWLHANVRDWPVTTKIVGAKVANGQIQFPYDKANVWPVATSGTGKDTNANPWAIVQIGGTWYAATWEWLRAGQTSKPMWVLDKSTGKGDHFKVSPLNNWKPKSGERFYVMVSGHARSTGRNVKERSDPVEVVWK
jgi:hypothetical protein